MIFDWGIFANKVIGPIEVGHIPIFREIIAGHDDDHDIRMMHLYHPGELKRIPAG
jgi:hypothetical protein